MARQVSWRWVPGAVCPHCAGAVQWLTETVPDPHSVTGFAEVRQPTYVMLDKPACEADRPVETTVASRGHEETVRRRYRHALDVFCPNCNVMMSSYSLRAGEPSVYPAGYWAEVE